MNNPEQKPAAPDATFDDFAQSVKVENFSRKGGGAITATVYTHSDWFGCLCIHDEDDTLNKPRSELKPGESIYF